MKMYKWFWGLLLIGGGLLLLLNAFGIGEDYDVIRILGSCLLLGIAVASVSQFRFVLFFIPLAVIVYLWRIPLGITDLHLGLLIGAAALLGIGLSILFRRKGFHTGHAGSRGDWAKTEEILNDNEYASVDTSMGEHIKYIHANNLKKVRIKSSFSATKVYFDQCQVSSEGLEINVNGSFCEIVLNVPSDWRIDNQVSVFAGAVTNLQAGTAASQPRIILSGNVNFAELKIVYI